MPPPQVHRVVHDGAPVAGEHLGGDPLVELDAAPRRPAPRGSRTATPGPGSGAASRARTRTARPRRRRSSGSRAGTTTPNVLREVSLSTTKAVPPRRITRSSSRRPGSQPGPKKYAHRACMTSTLAGGSGTRCAVPVSTVTFGSPAVRRAASRARSGCGSTPCTERAPAGPAGQVEAGAAAEVEHVAPGPAGPAQHLADRVLDDARRGRRSGSRARRSRCGARCSGSARSRAAGPPSAGARRAPAQMRTTPSAVANRTATTPGVPCGATHSTLGVLERTLDAVAQPVADPGRVAGDLQGGDLHLAAAALAGVLVGRGLPLDEERQLRVGLQALDADLPPAQLDAVGAVPVALARTRARIFISFSTSDK